MSHIPVLIIAVPMLGAALCFLIRRPVATQIIAEASAVLSLIGSVALLFLLSDTDFISYHLGGHQAPVGIELRIDHANTLILIVISAAASLILPWTRSTLKRDFPKETRPWLHSCFLLAFAGLLGVASTGDAFNLFVFLEISSLASYALVAMGAKHDKRALTASFNYLILGSIGAAFFVIGVGLLYAVTGTLNMYDLSQLIPPLLHNRAVDASFVFIVVGLSLKIALFPLHSWLPPAYAHAPAAVSAFLASCASKTAIYAFLRILLSVYDASFAINSHLFEFIIAPLALLAAVVGAVVACLQHELKRLAAWSSISQTGFILVAASIETTLAVASAFLIIIAHAAAKSALFTSLGSLHPKPSNQNLAGAAVQQPILGVTITIALLSLAGVPGTAGFIGKFHLVLAAFNDQQWALGAAVVFASLLSFLYVARALEILWRKPTQPILNLPKQSTLSLSAPIAAAAVSIVLGVLPAPALTASFNAAAALLSQ